MAGLAEDRKRIGELNTAADALEGLAAAPIARGQPRPELAAIMGGQVPRFGQTPPAEPGLAKRAFNSFLNAAGPQSIELLGAGLRTFATVAESETAFELGRKLEDYGRSLELGRPEPLPEVDSIGSAVEWAVLGVSQGLGSMGPPVVSGLAGATAGSVAGPKGAAVGGVVGAFGTNYLLMAGEATRQFEQSGVEPYKAAEAAQTIAPLMAALDTLGLAKIFRGPLRKEGEAFLGYLGKRLAQGATVESLTEMTQGAIREITDANLSGDPKAEERVKGILQEGIIAGLTGGVVAGVASPFAGRAPAEGAEGTASDAQPEPGPAPVEGDLMPGDTALARTGAQRPRDDMDAAIDRIDDFTAKRERQRYSDVTRREQPAPAGTEGEPPRVFALSDDGTRREVTPKPKPKPTPKQQAAAAKAAPAIAARAKQVKEKAARTKQERAVERVIGPARTSPQGQAGLAALTNAVVPAEKGRQEIDATVTPEATITWLADRGMVRSEETPVLTPKGTAAVKQLREQRQARIQAEAAPDTDAGLQQAAKQAKGQQQIKNEVAQGKDRTRHVALSGQREQSVTPKGQNVEVEYGVVDLSQVVASHNDRGTPNPAYPEALQPRNRAAAQSQDQIMELSSEGRFNPLLLMPSPSTDTGPPLVGRDLAVESGNGRMAVLERIYRREGSPDGSAAAGAYRERVAEWARANGQEARVQGMERPVLVRVRTDNADRRTVAVESNIDLKLAASAAEQAQTDAERIGGLAIIGNRSPADIKTAFSENLTSGERGAIVLADGRLSQAGEARVRNAILWEGWRNPRLQRRATEEGTEGVKRAVNVFQATAQAAASARFNGANLDPITEGLDYWLETHDRGESVDGRLAQVDVFADAPAVSGDSEAVARGLDEATSEKQVRAVVNASLGELRERGRQETEGDLVGGRTEMPLASLIQRALAEARGQKDMFSRRQTAKRTPRASPENTRRVQAEVDRITKDWDADKMPAIKVVANAYGLPEGLQRRLGDSIEHTKGILARGADGDVVYVVADQMTGTDDIQRTLLHEVVGHMSMMEMLGEDFGPLLTDVWLERDSGPWRAITREVAKHYPDADPNVFAAEMIAHAAERGLKTSLMQRIAAAVRAVLKKLGFRVATTFDEVMSLLSRAERRLHTPVDATAVDPDSMAARVPMATEALRDFYQRRGEKPGTTTPPATGLGRYIDPLRPIESAFRLMTIPLGGLNAQGTLRVGEPAKKISKRLLYDMSPKPDSVFGFASEWLEIARHGWFNRYQTPDGFQILEHQLNADEFRVMQELVGILEGLTEQNITADEARVLQDVLEGKELTNERMKAMAAPIRKRIDDMGAQMVKLGLLSKESYLRNLGQYLHRSYRQYEFDAPALVKMGRRAARRYRQGLQGDILKRRGLRLDVNYTRLMKDVPKAERKAAQAQKAWEIYEAIDPATDRVVQRVYRPRGDTPFTPPASRDGRVWVKAGDFELREAGQGVYLWRDYTPQERERMGEIRDARYNLIKTFELFARDLARGKFFQDVASNDNWFQTERPETGNIVDGAEVARFYSTVAGIDWVRVPNTIIPKSNAKRWGAIAGGYLRAALWRDMIELQKMQNPNLWQHMLREWKLNKAPRSLRVHFNNIVGNLFMCEMYDFTLADLMRGAREMASKGDMFLEAVEAGAFGAGMIQTEMKRRSMSKVIENIEKEVAQQERGGRTALEAMLGFFSKVYDLEPLRVAYQWEDDVFRMVSYVKDRNAGIEAGQAAHNARVRFLNYDVRAPWPNFLRRSVLPFFSYTYAFVPQFARTVVERPWKIAKIATMAYAVAALSYEMVEGDEEEERRAMSERETGYTPFGTPKMLRLPVADEKGNPVYLGMTRVLPGGGMLETDTNQLGLPEWMMVTGPLLVASEVLLNRTSYTGQDIVDEVDTGMEKAEKRLTYLWRAAMPNLPWIPGSWEWKTIERALGDEVDVFGREYSVGLALARQLGPRLYPYAVDAEKARRMMEIERELRQYHAKLREIGMDYGQKRIGKEARDKGVARVERGMRDLKKRADYVQGK